MKTLLIFEIILLISLSYISCDTPEHIKAYTESISKQCKAKTKVTEEDLQVIKLNQIPETTTGLNYLQCLLEKMGVIVNGKFRKQGMFTTFDSLIKGKEKEERKKILKKIADQCEKELSDQKCNEPGCMGRKVFECLRKFEHMVEVHLPTKYLRR